MKPRLLFAALAAAGLTLAGCDNGPTETGSSAEVTVGFSASAASAAFSATHISSPVALADVVLEGDNGTLTITDVAFIVDEFKLERLDGSCEEADDDECETFETGSAFVELPLDGGIVPVVTQPIPVGTYVAMKFEVKDADFSETGDDASGVEVAAVLDAIEAAGFTDWPGNASLVIAGTFTPNGGDAQPFTAYFDAEIKIEMALDPALVIDAADGTIDVEVDPVAWFTSTDGTVVDLSAFDYAATGEVADFEAKLEFGFTKIELEGFDD